MRSLQHYSVTQPSLGSKAAPKFYPLTKHYITLNPNQTAEVRARSYKMSGLIRADRGFFICLSLRMSLFKPDQPLFTSWPRQQTNHPCRLKKKEKWNTFEKHVCDRALLYLELMFQMYLELVFPLPAWLSVRKKALGKWQYSSRIFCKSETFYRGLRKSRYWVNPIWYW